ncbi:hypothetical protein FHS15_000616 [Paenibacillus castaneae]|uniref:hypothetical protein n=1 Tax=Paenibacillus castaneae TaxID=474957 RepID=UPI001FBC05D2|nr:hypothetical protein [Paenibacillus castaneae]NIK75516.1 hypothetical protein [Paenibacillus castaneae]
MRYRIKIIFFIFLIGCSLFASTANASWAYMFVVNDGHIYTVSETQVDPKLIGSKIGKVTKYSDREGTYSGNFSNRYPKGTKYYEIKGIDIKEAIAIKEKEDRFIKAFYQGEYGGSRYGWQDFLPYISWALLLFFVIRFLIKRR